VSRKTRVTPGLIAKAKKVFKEAEKRSIIVGEGLNRAELRALERAELVRKMRTFGKAKYVGSAGTISYIWEWVGD